MNHTRIYLLVAAGLALWHWATPALADTTLPGDGMSPGSSGMEEISDAELANMRGRYTVNNNTVAWFGVKMISTWQTTSGQVLQSTLALNMDFSTSDIQPKITFEPSVTITNINAPLPPTANGSISRSVDGTGLANVGGVRQSVQVAGDGNQASNVTRLTVSDSGAAPPPNPGGGGATGIATATSNGATAVASFDGQNAHVLLTIVGQGAVEQWIRSGSVGQSVQLTADRQWVRNRMEIDLVRQSLAANAQLAQNVAQAIQLARGIGGIH
ncbi:MAG: hypothetical protein OQK79_11730 [Rhodanobacter sp.]|jgi:hypothetical protein|nr:hypothetical protein [Rhodanobacter sp.]